MQQLIRIIAALFVLSPLAAKAVPIYADTVNSFTGGTGFGVIDQSGGSYGTAGGTSGSGVFDPLSISLGLDGAALGLGGGSGPPGQIEVSFSTGSVIDGAGADVRLFDTFGLSEAVSVEAWDGLAWLSLGLFAHDFSMSCSPASPCAADFDLATAGLASASFFRITAVVGGCVFAYPECYDLDAVEALNFSAAVPETGTLALLGLGLVGMGLARRRKTV